MVALALAGRRDWRGFDGGRSAAKGSTTEGAGWCGFARGFVWDRLLRQGGGCRELSQQLSAQLGGFISIGTICCAK